MKLWEISINALILSVFFSYKKCSFYALSVHYRKWFMKLNSKNPPFFPFKYSSLALKLGSSKICPFIGGSKQMYVWEPLSKNLYFPTTHGINIYTNLGIVVNWPLTTLQFFLYCSYVCPRYPVNLVSSLLPSLHPIWWTKNLR